MTAHLSQQELRRLSRPCADRLAALHRKLDDPSDDGIAWLLGQEISPDSMCFPWTIRSASVEFAPEGGFPGDPDGFHFNGDCQTACILRAEAYGQTTDLIAWNVHTGELASWRGKAAFLGDVEQIDDPSLCFAGGSLSIHACPIDWFANCRSGICIVNEARAATMLSHVRRLSFEDVEHAKMVRELLRSTNPQVEILVEVERSQPCR
jgi:hypothetical protein